MAIFDPKSAWAATHSFGAWFLSPAKAVVFVVEMPLAIGDPPKVDYPKSRAPFLG